MTDTPNESDGSVLRPFTPAEADPLPPVEASKVVLPETEPEPAPAAPAATSGQVTADDAFWAPEGATADAAPSPVVGGGTGTVTLPKKPFAIGVAALLGLLVLLVFLWRSGGDAAPVADSPDEEPASSAEVVDEADGASSSDPAVDAEAEARIADLERDVVDLGGQVADMEAELAAVQPPALPGSAMRRIVVAADASFVSLGNEGLAVVGPFGGYAAVDPATNSVTASAQVASGATRVMRTASAVWITNYTGDQIVRVDPVRNAVVHTIDFEGPDGIAKLGGTLIVASFDGGFVARVAPQGNVQAQVDVGGSPSDVLVSDDGSAVWAAIYDTGEIVRIDTGSFALTDRITVGAGPVGLTLADGVLWVSNHGEGTVAAVDPETLAVLATVAVGAGPTAVEIYNGFAWVSVTDAGELVQLDRTTYEIVTRTPLGRSNRGGPTGMTVGADSLWIAMQGERSVVRVSLDAG